MISLDKTTSTVTTTYCTRENSYFVEKFTLNNVLFIFLLSWQTGYIQPEVLQILGSTAATDGSTLRTSPAEQGGSAGSESGGSGVESITGKLSTFPNFPVLYVLI